MHFTLKLSSVWRDPACWSSPEFEWFVSLFPRVGLFSQTRSGTSGSWSTRLFTPQPGTGSADPATNWNFKVRVKCVPTWNAARAPGQVSLLRQEAPWGPQEAPQSLLTHNPAFLRGPLRLGQTAETSALRLTLPLYHGRLGPGRVGMCVCEAWFCQPIVVHTAILCGTDQLCQQPLKPQGRNTEHNVCIHFFIHFFIHSFPPPLPP